jgi:hypothetical protein
METKHVNTPLTREHNFGGELYLVQPIPPQATDVAQTKKQVRVIEEVAEAVDSFGILSFFLALFL